MQKYIFFLAITTLFFFAQCSPTVDTPENDTIVGCWINPTSGEDYTIVIYERAPTLSNEQSYCFEEDGTLIENKNVGFCGTPPITYGNFDGTWTLDGSDFILNVDSWNGIYETHWELISVDENYLKLKYVP